METKSKSLEGNNLEITVTLSSEEVQKEIDAAYKEAGKNRIPGFRPGKAPRKILENHFGGKEFFQAQATDELVRVFTPLSADELKVVPLGSPEFSEFDLAVEGEPFTYSFSLEITPELKLSSYDPVQIELPSLEPSEEEMQTQIDALLNYNLTTDEEGKEHRPELTDAWVKETFEFESVDELKERLADSLRQQKEQDIPLLKEARSASALAKRLEGEVPNSLIQQTEQDRYRDLFQSLQQQHMTLDSYLEMQGLTPESFREHIRDQAVENATMSLALDALAKNLGLETSEEEMLEEFEKSGAKDPKKLFEDWRKNGRLSEIRQGLLRMKAARHLYDTAEIFEPGTLKLEVAEDEELAKKTPANKKTKDKAAPKKKVTKKAEAAPREDAPKKTTKKKEASAAGNTKKTSTKEAAKKTSKKASAKKVDTKKAPSSED